MEIQHNNSDDEILGDNEEKRIDAMREQIRQDREIRDVAYERVLSDLRKRLDDNDYQRFVDAFSEIEQNMQIQENSKVQKACWDIEMNERYEEHWREIAENDRKAKDQAPNDRQAQDKADAKADQDSWTAFARACGADPGAQDSKAGQAGPSQGAAIKAVTPTFSSRMK